mmetsp:Transcript_19170/g.19304  ORF Transcript_19170/g.19304 Transcript_19170/m.19304 type:complete len:212 (+) Transcript_19170:450-1085(+)
MKCMRVMVGGFTSDVIVVVGIVVMIFQLHPITRQSTIIHHHRRDQIVRCGGWSVCVSAGFRFRFYYCLLFAISSFRLSLLLRCFDHSNLYWFMLFNNLWSGLICDSFLDGSSYCCRFRQFRFGFRFRRFRFGFRRFGIRFRRFRFIFFRRDSGCDILYEITRNVIFLICRNVFRCTNLWLWSQGRNHRRHRDGRQDNLFLLLIFQSFRTWT